MIDLSNILQGSEHVLKRKLSLKPESAVLLMERPGGSPVMLRVYDQEVPAYRLLEGHGCQYLPQVYRAGEIAGLFVVEEEYVDGVSLLEMISGGYRFNPERTIALSLKICSALDFLHNAGFIHRDVKPEQFGITRSDARTDVYAMGLLMNEMLTGVHPTVKQYREGNQSTKYYTQDGMEVDQTFHVYADESIGVVTGWDEEYEAWDLCSGCTWEIFYRQHLFQRRTGDTVSGSHAGTGHFNAILPQ